MSKSNILIMKQYFINNLFIIIYALFSFSCQKIEIENLSQTQTCIIQQMPKLSFIAHRGTSYWAPENTEAAMRWARNAGATYLECDLQRTADGYLVLYHDLSLGTKSNIHYIYKASDPKICDYTLEELFKLDFGSWYNIKYPNLARQSFYGLDILTLEDLIKIAEGFRIKRNNNKRLFHKKENRIITEYEPDPYDNGNRPGIYLEIKYSNLYPDIEKDLKDELERLGWYANNIADLKNIPTIKGQIQTANSLVRVVIQTTSANELKNINTTFSRKIPFCYILSSPNNKNIQEKAYKEWINTAIQQNAVIIAPSINNKDANTTDLLQPWMYELIKKSELLIHAYTFDNTNQIQYYEDRFDGIFCNKIESAIQYFTNKQQTSFSQSSKNGSTILDELGYY